MLWSKSEITEHLKLWASAHNKTPTQLEWQEGRQDTQPTLFAIRTAFGQWSHSIAAAGLAPRTSGATREWVTKTIAVKCLQEWSHRHGGETPSCREWNGTREKPNYRTLLKLFGSWNNALRAAGLETRRSGERKNAGTCHYLQSRGGTDPSKRNRIMVTGGR